MVNKYNLCDKVRTKIHYENDNRKEVDAFIRGIELVDETDEIRYFGLNQISLIKN